MERIGEARSVARHRHARLRRSRACCQVWRTLLHANDFNPGRAARGKGASCRPPAEYSRIDSRPSKWSKTVEGTLWWPLRAVQRWVVISAEKSALSLKKVLFYQEFPERRAKTGVVRPLKRRSRRSQSRKRESRHVDLAFYVRGRGRRLLKRGSNYDAVAGAAYPQQLANRHGVNCAAGGPGPPALLPPPLCGRTPAFRHVVLSGSTGPSVSDASALKNHCPTVSPP